MPRDSERVQILKQEIETAFSDIQYPGNDNLVYKDDDIECMEIADAFRGQHWKQVSQSTLVSKHSSLSFFSPEAYRFYLPAYMLACALYYDKVDIVSDYVIYSLTPPPNSQSSEMEDFLTKIDGFTPAQRIAIKSFLEFMRDEHADDYPQSDDPTREQGPAVALRRYWGK